ncbi:hypothetical protein MRX96_043637 [Rhipicephalus microplus]
MRSFGTGAGRFSGSGLRADNAGGGKQRRRDGTGVSRIREGGSFLRSRCERESGGAKEPEEQAPSERARRRRAHYSAAGQTTTRCSHQHGEASRVAAIDRAEPAARNSASRRPSDVPPLCAAGGSCGAWRRPVSSTPAAGVRADYIDHAVHQGFARLAQAGIRAEYVLPVFPSSPYPNAYSIATGAFTSAYDEGSPNAVQVVSQRSSALSKDESVAVVRPSDAAWLLGRKTGERTKAMQKRRAVKRGGSFEFVYRDEPVK